ncbi:phosphoesterase [Halorubrum sp. Atlit-8R]|uniref:metallophosphoesterase n=1 Tax=unclassified Halorubrum TaxID=2642239 RepID=UPI000EF1E2E2|nr:MULTISPECIES: metallophosphoesterase [unclassified Halorubrum]RLM71223.1 phosphoesterase [Halorubrum sp. Atlit-9R]RLM72091.1 phosphoesterase [Halorubrum sp. Atlit-9R]RLM82625.1 phosphoesterase [Halorubrum sp. Atlit-8R]
MARVEPVVGEPAAVADLGGERALLVADVHAGIEVGLRYERGVELDSRADARRERLCDLLAETDADRLVVLGDLAHRIGAPDGDEREELETLVRAVTDRVPMTLVEGNHDAGVAEAFADDLDVIGPEGGLLGDSPGAVGVCHGHTWPDPGLLDADVVCTGHEHPQVRLEDAVGGSRVERAWLRGELDPAAFTESGDEGDRAADSPELVVFPAFNERSGGTWVNVEGQSFLAPYLPAALPAADAYLLDGTRLGDYRGV